MRGERILLLPLVVALGIAFTASVRAEDAAPVGDEHAEVIVITAERRERALTQLPGSVAVVTAEELDASSLLSTQDLALRTPGLSFTHNTVLGQPYIRGVGSNLIAAGADPSVAAFVDGAYQPRFIALEGGAKLFAAAI